ncbi:MAG: chemosensory pili system protein ChpC [Gammaproteobacteria bacterium]|jgi:chemosensory pili system protein ChpC
MNDGSTRSVRCMLLPLVSINLLIPNSAVAEILAYSRPQSLADSSDWFKGVVSWRGVYLPVVAVEEMCFLGATVVGPRSRIAVLYNPVKDSDLPYLGIHMQDIPRAYLAESPKMESGSDTVLSRYLLSRVDDESLSRMIPNLDNIFGDLKAEFTADKLLAL